MNYLSKSMITLGDSLRTDVIFDELGEAKFFTKLLNKSTIDPNSFLVRNQTYTTWSKSHLMVEVKQIK